jgi:septum formation inhibitor-activating ATPase MinD
VLDHRTSEQSKRTDLLVALLLKPPAQQLELLPAVDGLDADLLVDKLEEAQFEYVMVDGRMQLR